MTDSIPFYMGLTIGPAFLGARAQRLADLISDQGDAFFREAGIVIPVRTVSTVLYLRQQGPSSLVQIAAALGEPHQVTAKRTARLQALSMVSCKVDPNDKRRKLFRLTRKGNRESDLIDERCKDAIRIFETLNRDLNLHLGHALDAAHAALSRQPMVSRQVKANSDG